MLTPPPGPAGGGEDAKPDRANLGGAHHTRQAVVRSAERMREPDVIIGSAIRIVRGPEMAGVPRGARWIVGIWILGWRIRPAGFGTGQPRFLPGFHEAVGLGDRRTTQESEHGSYRSK